MPRVCSGGRRRQGSDVSCPIIACDWCSGRSDDRPECPAHPTCRDVIRAWEQGREAFRREVAEALEVVLRDFESESFGCQDIERATREARSYAEAAKALNMQGAYNYAAARVAGLLKKLEAGTFPKPPPSSGGGGGG